MGGTAIVAIVYARVSSEDQARAGFSLASQVEAGTARARELGARETVIVSDDGVPGDVLDRPGLQTALAAMRGGGVSFFVCLDPDRLARSLSLQLLVTDLIERAGVRLEFVHFDYQHTPEGQLFYALRGAISQYEKAKIRERTMRGKRQKAKAGGLTHNPGIFGYDFDPVTDSLSTNEDQGQVVQMIYRWFLQEDMGPWAIADRLTKLGIPPARGGKGWHHSSVRNILRNASYTGTLHLQKWDYTDTRTNKYRPRGEKVPRRVKPESQWIPMLIPPIIDRETHQAALSKLANARRWWSGWHREEYLISGLGVCAICSKPIYGASRQSGRSRIRYYVCRGYAPGVPGQPRCAFGRMRADPVEAEIWREIRNLILTPRHRLEARVRPGNVTALQQQAATLQRRLADLKAERERTARLTVRGTISPELGENLLEEQQQKISDLAAELADLETQTTRARSEDVQSRTPAELRRFAAPIVDELDFAGRQRAVRAFVKDVRLSKDETTLRVRLAPLEQSKGQLV